MTPARNEGIPSSNPDWDNIFHNKFFIWIWEDLLASKIKIDMIFKLICCVESLTNQVGTQLIDWLNEDLALINLN